MGKIKRINYINAYWKEKFGKRTLKIGIDGEFTCPNRDGTKSTNGCIFCNDCGSGEHLNHYSIETQIENYFKSYRAERADSFILYFQNFSNTYDSIDFTKAVSLLNSYNIDVVAHIMVGLPGETNEDIINTTNFINSHRLHGIKIHSTYVLKNTKLALMYEQKKYLPIALEEYLTEVTYILTHISPCVVVHRISGDAPKDLLIALEWNTHKKLVMNGIFNKFEKEDLYQGMYYKKFNTN